MAVMPDVFEEYSGRPATTQSSENGRGAPSCCGYRDGTIRAEVFEVLRQHMLGEISVGTFRVRGSIGKAALDERVLMAMAKVPRHEFVPIELQPYAYANIPLPIGFDKTISQPFIVALMTDLLDISADDAVLEVLPRPFRARRSGREVRERCSFESNAKHQLAIKLSPTLAHSSYSDQQWAILHRRPTR